MKQLILLLAIASGVIFAYGFIHRDFINSPDAAIYADMARHIREEARPVSSFAMPDYFTYFGQDSSGFFRTQYPLFFPLVLVGAFTIFRQADWVVVFTSTFFYLATIPLLLFFAKRIYGSGVASLSTIFYIFNPSMASAAVSGMSETLFTFQVTSIFLLLTFKKVWLQVLTGVVLATAVLTRYQGELLTFAVLVMVPILYGQARARALFFLIFGFLASILVVEVIFPGTISHYLEASRYLVDVGLFWDRQFDTLKVLANSFRLIKEGIFFAGPLVSIFFFLSLTFKEKGVAAKFKWFLFSSLALFFVSFLPLIFDVRFVWPFIPIVCVFAASAFRKVVKGNLATFAICLIFLGGVFLTSNANGTYFQWFLGGNFNKPTIFKIVANIASENIPHDYVIASDWAAHIAWYEARSAIQLPKSPQELEALEKNYQKIDAIFLTDYPQGEWKSNWREMLENPHDFGDFSLVSTYTIEPKDNFYNYPVRTVLFLNKTL